MASGYLGSLLDEQKQDQVPDIYIPEHAQISTPQYSSVDMNKVATDGATGATMGPEGAAIAAGGSFLTQYMANQAANEREKRKLISEAYQNQSRNEQNAINSIMSNNARVLS